MTRDRLELATQVRRGALLDRLGDLLHLGRALVLGQTFLARKKPTAMARSAARRGQEQDGPLTALQVEYLVAAFGGKDVLTPLHLVVWGAPDAGHTVGGNGESVGTFACDRRNGRHRA